MSVNMVFMATVRQKTGCLIVSELVFHPQRKWQLDYAIPECMVAIEVEGGAFKKRTYINKKGETITTIGGRHNSGTGFLKDMEKYNEAVLAGWKLLRCTPQTLLSKKFIEQVEKLCKNQ